MQLSSAQAPAAAQVQTPVGTTTPLQEHTQLAETDEVCKSPMMRAAVGEKKVTEVSSFGLMHLLVFPNSAHGSECMQQSAQPAAGKEPPATARALRRARLLGTAGKPQRGLGQLEQQINACATQALITQQPWGCSHP